MHRIVLVFFALLIVGTLNLYAQPEMDWDHDYGGGSPSVCSSIISTTDGNYVFTGNIQGANRNIYLVKIDGNGEEIWSRQFSSDESDLMGMAVIQTSDGGYAIGGTSSNDEGSFYTLLKTNSDGEELWRQDYSYDFWNECYGIQQASDGGYVLAGTAYSQNFDSSVMYAVRTDTSGTEQWYRVYVSRYNEAGLGLIRVSYGNFVCVGYSHVDDIDSPNNNIFLVNFHRSGQLLWRWELETQTYDLSASIVETDSGFMVGGQTGIQSTDFLLVKLDTLGREVTRFTYGGPEHESTNALLRAEGSGYLICGNVNEADSVEDGDYDFKMLRVSEQGELIWTETYGGARDDVAYTTLQTPDGGFLLGGRNGSRGLSSKAWLIKTNPDPASVPDDRWKSHPAEFILHPAYPNPFNAKATISYTINTPGMITLNVINESGQFVGNLSYGWHSTGGYQVEWNSHLPSGVYFIHLNHSGIGSELQKVILLK